MLRRLLVVLIVLLVVYVGWEREPLPQNQIVEVHSNDDVNLSEIKTNKKSSLRLPQQSRQPTALSSATVPVTIDGTARRLSPDEKNDRIRSSTEHLKRLSELASGPRIRASNETFYREVPALKAYPEAYASRVAADDIVEKRGGLIFVKKPLDEAEGWTVVWNENAGRLGALSGHVKVKLKNSSDAQSFAHESGLGMVRYFEPIQTLVLSAAEGQDLTQILDSLRHDSRVVKADLEVLESTQRAQ